MSKLNKNEIAVNTISSLLNNMGAADEKPMLENLLTVMNPKRPAHAFITSVLTNDFSEINECSTGYLINAVEGDTWPTTTLNSIIKALGKVSG